MAAIFRFGFENSRVPEGVSLTSYKGFSSGRFSGTTSLYGFGPTSAAIVNVPVSGNYVSSSFFCWVTGSIFSDQNPEGVDYTLATFYGNSVGFSSDSLWIKTEAGVIQRISKEELSGTIMVAGVAYYATVEFRLGVDGYIALYWDGLKIEYSGNTGSVPAGITNLSVQCPAIANVYITPDSMPSYWEGATGYLDDVAVNDSAGSVDNTCPGPIACFPSSGLSVESNTGWLPADNVQMAINLGDSNSGTVASSQTKGAVLTVGFETNVPIQKTGFEGINIYLDGMSKTGSGKIGMRWGWSENGINYQGGDDINLGYVGVSRSISRFYRSGTADPNTDKFTVADGEALSTYFEVV